MIGPSAFSGCSSLAKIDIPSSVVNIEKQAFKDCIGLKEILIPSSVKKIGKEAFKDCSNLKKIILYKGTIVPKSAFYGLSKSEVNIKILNSEGVLVGDMTLASFLKLYAKNIENSNLFVSDLLDSSTETAGDSSFSRLRR